MQISYDMVSNAHLIIGTGHDYLCTSFRIILKLINCSSS